MDFDQVTLLFALLGLIAQVGVIALLVPAVREAVAPAALWIAASVALVATVGSLYLSEVADLPPCRLCWFQRIAIYPLVPILVVAAIRRDRAVRYTVWAITAIGTPISLWHVLIERNPGLEGGSCDPLNPCSIVWFRHFGYLTIPALAAVTQIAVAALVSLDPKERP